MSVPTPLPHRAWLIDGALDPGALRDRAAACAPAVHVERYDLSADGADPAGWGGLVRGEVEAARHDPAPARVTLARLAPDRHLAVVVMRDGHDATEVLRWVLDPGRPAPGPVRVAAARGPGSPPLALPGALRTGAFPSGSAATVRRACGPARTRSGRDAGVGAEAGLAAAVAVLLARYRSRPDAQLHVGTPQPVSLPLVVDDGALVGDWMRRVTHDLRAARPVPADEAATVAVACPPTATPERIGSCTVTPVDVDDGPARHELSVSLSGGVLRIDHDAALFGPEAVGTFADRLVVALAELGSAARVGDVTALTATERAGLAAWSRGPDMPAAGGCLHTLVERHAAATPRAPAVVCGDEVLDHGELDARANRVAHRLVAAGVRRGDLVALLAGRSAGSVVAMLGVLKAGAAYVPIEPSHPADRIRHVVVDSGARVVLAAGPQAGTLPVPVLDLEEPGPPRAAPDVPVHPDDLAYVIYTSGSTGAAKGVAVQHRSAVASTRARDIGGPPPEQDLVTMPLCFDGAAGGLYWTLTGGGTVVLPTEEEAHDPVALRELLRRVSVTHVHSVPSHYDLLLRCAPSGALARLRLVSVGGEPMPPRLVARHLLDHPGATLLNDYGPTECTVWATAHRCGLADARGADVPIGGPLPGYRVHVLDAHLRPVPPDLPGEIYIGGAGVARGYHARPGLSAGRFLPDPFGAPGERLYRTGDRGRWSAAGELYALGRVDRQVKVRGFRVELGDIEAAVREHPGVADCAAVVRAAGGGDRIVAFVASDVADGVGLHGHARRVLPTYMRPDRYVVLPELPRGTSGKIDLQALRGFDLGPDLDGAAARRDVCGDVA